MKKEKEQLIKKFLKILAEKNTEALTIFLQNKRFRSDSVAEEKFNDSVERFYKSLEQDPTELTIKQFLQFYNIKPVTQKTKYLQDYYVSAEQAMSEYFENFSFYKHLYHLQEIINQVHLLHRKALCRRGWKIEREKNDITVTLEKEKDSDVTTLTLKIGEEEYEHPYYIRTACKRESISLDFCSQKGINEGEWRISVIVNSPSHVLATDLEICRDEHNFQAWRRDWLSRDRDFPLSTAWKLPLSGTTVRQGDVVYRSCIEIPYFSTITLPDGFIQSTCAHRQVTGDDFIIEHPDHLPVRLIKPDWREGKDTWHVCAERVSGWTDYRPSGEGD